jgi:predicted nucleic acid-binding protein
MTHWLRCTRNCINDADQFEILRVDMAMLDEAAKIGAYIGLKLIDATHLCSAIVSGCDVLITNDQKFKSSPKLQIIQISSL